MTKSLPTIFRATQNVAAGRFQIIHRGHEFVFKQMLENANEAMILQVDLAPNDLNPHSSKQIEKMATILFPEEFKSGKLRFAPLSSLNCGGLKNKELWEKISGGEIEKLKSFFGKKSSPDDQVNGRHYMEHLAQEFGFIPVPIAPLKRNNASKDDISASNLLLNPYHVSLKYSVSNDVVKYMATLWQTALDEDCLISEVEEPNQNAYTKYCENFYKLGKLPIVTKDGRVALVDKENVLGKTMLSTPDR